VAREGTGRGFKIPEILTTEEQQALLGRPNPRYPTGERNRLIMQIMLNTGVRLSEAINLRWTDVNLTTGKLMVRSGKGNKDRSLWLSEADLAAVRQWRERQAVDAGGECVHVFTTLDGGPLCARYVQRMVRRYSEQVGIAKSVHPHTLRHSFGTDLYRETKDIRLTQRALGHASIATTQIYTHIVDEQLEEALKTFRHAPVPEAVTEGAKP